MRAPDGLPVRLFRDATAWEAWLSEHHAQPDGIWLKLAKKHSAKRSVGMTEAVEVALCYGWIDSQERRIDDDFVILRFTPRRKRSMWSKRNVARAEALVAAGRMRPAGLAEIDRAKADGRWAAAY